MTTIIANIPKRNGQAAHIETFRQDEAGQWSLDFGGFWGKVLHGEVIDVCRKASNWPQIKSEHFPIYGFHNQD